MTRINTNVASLFAQRNLNRSNLDLENRLQRLATGLRINRGADDPAGLIVSERLRTELRGIEQGIKNSERATNVIATAEGALAEVSELLNSIKALVVEAANSGAFSTEEIEANQLQIDSALDSITRISNTSSFAGLKLLNGSLAYRVSGIDQTNIIKSQVFGANFGDRTTIPVDVEVIGSAQQANLHFRTDFSNLGGATDGVLPSATVLEIAGPLGVQELSFPSGTATSSIVAAINARTAITGVQAVSQSISTVVFNSVGYGSESFVSVDRLSGGTSFQFASILNNQPGPINWAAPATYTTADTDFGKDVETLVNGAFVRGRGLDVTLRDPSLDLRVTLDATFATTITGVPEDFVITGGGALYQLGPQVNAQQQVSVGIASIAATRLGGALVTKSDGTQEVQFLSSLKEGGDNALSTSNFVNASAILDQAIDEISQARGRFGAFERNVLQTNIRSLQAGLENITSSESIIRDADFAEETSALTRSQILTQAGTSVLATANTNAQNVLQLLG
ncbi:MAG: flagellin [Phycisphaerales bacterium]